MAITEHPKKKIDELALVKVAAWTWYRHGPGSEPKRGSESDYTASCDNVVRPSRYKLEALNKAKDDTRMPIRYSRKSMLCGDRVDSCLLDVYEIERISEDLDYYIESSCDEYYCRKFVDGVRGGGGRRIMPVTERDSGAKSKIRSKHKNLLKVSSYRLCGLNKGDVVEDVGFLTTEQRWVKEKHIPMAGDANFQRRATSR